MLSLRTPCRGRPHHSALSRWQGAAHRTCADVLAWDISLRLSDRAWEVSPRAVLLPRSFLPPLLDSFRAGVYDVSSGLGAGRGCLQAQDDMRVTFCSVSGCNTGVLSIRQGSAERGLACASEQTCKDFGCSS